MRRGLLPMLGALLLTVAVYAPRLSAPFAWDDLQGIAYNDLLEKPVPWRAYVSDDFFRLSPYNNTWRPLSHWAMRSVARAAGRSPLAHRLPGFLLHLACGLLLCALASSFGLPREAACWAAALFLLHPVQVESVMCASHLSTTLTGAGLLGALLWHREGRRFPAAAALAVGMLSKEHGILGLPLAWLSDRLEGKRPRFQAFAGLLGAAALYGAVRFFWLRGTSVAQNLGAAIPWGERLVLAAEAWVVSWRVLIWPSNLRVEYFAVPSESLVVRVAWVFAAATSAALVAGLAWRARRKAPVAAFAFAWAALPLLAVSPLAPENVLNLRLTAERFLYAPAMGLALLLAWALRARPVLLGCVLAGWTALSWQRTGDWSDETRLWNGLARIYPWSSKAHEGAADAWMRRGDFAQAAAEYEAALRVRSSREDRVLAHYVPLTNELSWERSSVHRGLGRARMALGDAEGASPQFRRAIELAPAEEGYSFRALAYLEARRGRFAEARRVAEQGLLQHPSDALLARLAAEAAAGRLTFGVRFD